MDDRDEPRTGRVRIIGAEPVGDAGPLGDENLPDEPDDDTALPHWTEAPTGQVPAVLSGGEEEDDSPWRSLPTPTWREERTDWAAHEEAYDASVLAAADEVTDEDGERQPWSFDLDPMGETSVVPAVGRGAHAARKPEELFGDLTEPGPHEDEDHWRDDDRFAGSAAGAAGRPPARSRARSEAPDAFVDTGEVEEVADRWGTAGGGGDRWGTAGELEDVDEPGGEALGEPTGPVRSDVVGLAGHPPDRRRSGGRLGEDEDLVGGAVEDEERDDEEPAGSRRTGRGGPVRIVTRGVAGRRPAPLQPPGVGGSAAAGVGRGAGAGPAGARRRPGRRAGGEAAGQPGGRNIPVAIASGVVLGGVALLCFAFGTVSSMVVVTAVVGLAAVEGYAAFRKAGYHPATLVGLVAVVGLMVGVYNRGEAAEPLVVVLLVAFTLLWHLLRVDKGADPVRSTLSTLFVYCWVGVFGSYAALLLSPTVFSHRHGIAYLLGAVITVVAYDVAALGVGSWVGHRPLTAISPNKTWEGLIGGTVVAIVVAVMVVHLIHPWTIGKAAALGVIVAVLAPIGDLAESLVKRHVGVKDMGRVLPGHGGLLDRVDGLLFVLPATYYLVRAFHLG